MTKHLKRLVFGGYILLFCGAIDGLIVVVGHFSPIVFSIFMTIQLAYWLGAIFEDV